MSEASASIWPRIIPGTCRHCGCTESDACPDPWNEDIPDEIPGCSWADRLRTTCSVCHRLGGPPSGFPRSAAQWQAKVDLAARILRKIRRRRRHVPRPATLDDVAELMADDPAAFRRMEGTLWCETIIRRGAALGFFPTPRPARPSKSTQDHV